MAVTKAFYDAVNEGNLLRVHIMMKDSLLLDRTFKEFADMEKAASNMKNLYVPYDGGELKESSNEWNSDYMNTLLVKLLKNFSHERVDHLKRVITFLHPVRRNSADSYNSMDDDSMDYYTRKMLDQKNGSFISDTGKFATFGGALGAVVGTATATVAGTSAIAGAAIGAAVGAITGCVIAKGGKK